MTARMARWVSIALHPFVVLALLTAVAVLRLELRAWRPVLIAFAIVVAVVMGLSLWRARSGAWNSVDASDKRDRPLLYAVVLGLLGVYAWWLRGHAPALLPGVLALIAMCVLAALANRWIKLSLHMACLAYAAVAAASLSMPLSVVFAACLPALAWSRLRMGRHTRAEVIGGTVLGALAGVAVLLQR